MKFIIGSPPAAELSAPLGQGWQELPGLGGKAVQNYGLAASGVAALLVGVFIHWGISPSSLWTAALILVTILPLHELVHALFTPAWGLSDRTVIGFQRGKGLLLPYMYFDGSQPLWRMLLTGLAPLLLLSVLPAVVLRFAPLTDAARADLGFLSFFNASMSGGDLVVFFWLVTRLPLRAAVKGNGWSLLWKSPADGSARRP